MSNATNSRWPSVIFRALAIDRSGYLPKVILLRLPVAGLLYTKRQDLVPFGIILSCKPRPSLSNCSLPVGFVLLTFLSVS